MGSVKNGDRPASSRCHGGWVRRKTTSTSSFTAADADADRAVAAAVLAVAPAGAVQLRLRLLELRPRERVNKLVELLSSGSTAPAREGPCGAFARQPRW